MCQCRCATMCNAVTACLRDAWLADRSANTAQKVDRELFARLWAAILPDLDTCSHQNLHLSPAFFVMLISALMLGVNDCMVRDGLLATGTPEGCLVICALLQLEPIALGIHAEVYLCTAPYRVAMHLHATSHAKHNCAPSARLVWATHPDDVAIAFSADCAAQVLELPSYHLGLHVQHLCCCQLSAPCDTARPLTRPIDIGAQQTTAETSSFATP